MTSNKINYFLAAVFFSDTFSSAFLGAAFFSSDLASSFLAAGFFASLASSAFSSFLGAAFLVAGFFSSLASAFSSAFLAFALAGFFSSLAAALSFLGAGKTSAGSSAAEPISTPALPKLSLRPARAESATSLQYNLIERIASSFPGIG